MPRDSSGNYTLPLPEVAAGEVISSAWANQTLADVAQTLQDSLDRQGRGGMLSPFRFSDGTKQAPGAAWINEPATGLYRAGNGDLRVSLLGDDIFRWANNKVEVFSGGSWKEVVTSQNAQTAAQTSFDDATTTYIKGANVQDALSSADTQLVAVEAQQQAQNVATTTVQDNLDVHTGDADIHYPDAPNDSVPYIRRNKIWDLGGNYFLDVAGTAVDSQKVGGYRVVVTATLPGTPDANTLYFLTA